MSGITLTPADICPALRKSIVAIPTMRGLSRWEHIGFVRFFLLSTHLPRLGLDVDNPRIKGNANPSETQSYLPCLNSVLQFDSVNSSLSASI